MKIHDIALSQLRNNEHFQFVKDVAALLKTVPETVAAKIARQTDALARRSASRTETMTHRPVFRGNHAFY